MTDEKKIISSIDEYILTFPEDVQVLLQTLRKVVNEAAPDATEKISYQMPTFDIYGNLVHFAAYKNHIGFYPTPSGIEKFKNELMMYKNAKGSVQFPINEPIPYELITQIVKFRVIENTELHQSKKKKK